MALYKHQIEQEARVQETRYRTLFDSVPIGLFRCRPDGSLLMVNQALVAMLGFPNVETLLSAKTTDLYDQTDHRVECPLRGLDGSEVTEFRARMRRHDGSAIWIQATVHQVFHDGDLLYYEGSVENVTRKRETEEEVQQRAAQLEALNQVIAAAVAAPNLDELLDTALHEMLHVLDLKKGAIWAGDAAKGKSVSLSVGRSLARPGTQGSVDLPGIVAIDNWLEDKVANSWKDAAQVAARSGIVSSLAAPILANSRAIGGIILLASAARRWSAHEITFVEAIGRQLGTAAERLRLLETIREQVLRLHKIIHTVPQGVLLLDAQHHLILANPTAHEHLSSLTDAREGDILTGLGGTTLDRLLHGAANRRHEIEVDSRIVTVIAQAIETDDGPEGWVLLTQEVTDERNLQRRIEQRDRLAAVGQLAAGIAHDFSNIMAVVLLYAQMALREPKTPAKTRERLEVIGQQARRATDLIQQILDFSRNTLLERQRVDLVPFLKETIKLLDRTLPSDVVIDFNYGVGNHVVSADPTRVQQIVMNLALNARDAMKEGGKLRVDVQRVTVEAERTPSLPELTPGDWIRLSVSDTGEGIPPDVLPHIFEPFFTTKAPGFGSGLGLAQVYGIVEQHDGVIDVETEQGRGATFSIWLPALPQTDPESRLNPDRGHLAMGHNETVLVVEDSLSTRGALVESLGQLGYRALEAGDGREALSLIMQHGQAIDLVLTDVVMPRMGGLTLLEALPAADWNGPVIVLSGHPLESRLEEQLVPGRVTFLEKPVDLVELADVLCFLLNAAYLPVHADSLA
jgi:PAS domain S-box-containing protein